MKKPLILLHGALGQKSSLKDLKTSLTSQREIYSFNFSGHGGVSFSDDGFGIEVFADELAKFILENNLAKADIFGYSMGGYVALYLASIHPELIGSITTLGTKFDWNPKSADQETSRMNPEVMKEKIPVYTNFLSETHGKNWEELVYQTAGMMLELGESPILTQEILSTINTSVNIIRGDQDHMITEEESIKASAALPNGVYLTLSETPHPIEKVDIIKLAEELLKYCK